MIELYFTFSLLRRITVMTFFSESFEQLSDLKQHVNTAESRLSYGTAGFRANADSTPLDFVMFRVGCLIGLRSRSLGGVATGAMVTASHNGLEDNGVKMVEPDGSMLDPSWEVIADDAINAKSTEELRKILESVPMGSTPSSSGLVIVGFDTRSSSERLVQCLIRGCRAVNATVENYGLLTTPVLHHIVRHCNGHGHSITMSSVEGYSRMLKEGIHETLGDTSAVQRGRLVVDAAGGVGTQVLRQVLYGDNRLAKVLNEKLGITEIVISNESTDPKVELNEHCGAEFVQKKRLAPSLHGVANVGSDRIASFDGDADRLVYSYTHPTKGWRLLDGDKIATLYALFINTQLHEAKLEDAKLNVGLVQTAYANGASTHYVKNVMTNSAISIKLAKTGVKFVEHEAKNFDIGMYFEANGHGTVIFSSHAVKTFELARPRTNKLLGFYKLINQAVGDAISDCLGVEAVLADLNMTVEQWDNLYEDLPSRQGKIVIADRTLIKCTEDETRIISPASLQSEIDQLVAQAGPQARAFVRPSGTEDAARVYAEALSKEQANTLAFEVALAAWRAVGKPGSKMPQQKDYM
jgi:phosphoacetylglucosamine mutase